MQCIKKFAITSLIFYIRERVGWIPKVGDLTDSLAAQYGWVYGLSVTEMSVYLLKVNNRNTRTRCEICSKLTIKIPERRHRYLYC